MTSFDARLRINGRSRLPVAVEIDLTSEQMIINSDTGPVAELHLETLEVTTLADGFHMRIDGEDIILNVNDAPRFESELKSRMR